MHNMGKPVNILIVDTRVDGCCTLCGKITQVRPYGEGNAFICEACFRSNPSKYLMEMKQFMDQFEHVVFLED